MISYNASFSISVDQTFSHTEHLLEQPLGGRTYSLTSQCIILFPRSIEYRRYEGLIHALRVFYVDDSPFHVFVQSHHLIKRSCWQDSKGSNIGCEDSTKQRDTYKSAS